MLGLRHSIPYKRHKEGNKFALSEEVLAPCHQSAKAPDVTVALFFHCQRVLCVIQLMHSLHRLLQGNFLVLSGMISAIDKLLRLFKILCIGIYI